MPRLYNIVFATACFTTLIAAGIPLPGWCKWLAVIFTGVCLFVASELDHKRREAERMARRDRYRRGLRP